MFQKVNDDIVDSITLICNLTASINVNNLIVTITKSTLISSIPGMGNIWLVGCRRPKKSLNLALSRH